MLQSSQLKLQGLDALAVIFETQLVPVCQTMSASTLNNLFRGLRSCLQSHETQVDILMKVNNVLYDIMPELPKLPIDMQNEIFSLIPFLIENLGNPKVSSSNNLMLL